MHSAVTVTTRHLVTVTRDTMSHVSWATPAIGDGEQTVEDGGDPLHGNLLPWWRAGGGVAATMCHPPVSRQMTCSTVARYPVAQ